MPTRTVRSRVRKKAVPAASGPARQRRKTAPEPSGENLVGTAVAIYWAPSKSYFPALVLHYNAQKSLHTVIYFEDETVEELALGKGSGHRNFKREVAPEDDLVGKRITLLPAESDDGTCWFDFMKGESGEPGTEMTVSVFARITDEPDSAEICSPERPVTDKTPPLYYRIIHLANEYLATIDLTQVDYTIVSDIQKEDSAPNPSKSSKEKTPVPSKTPKMDQQNSDTNASKQLAADDAPPDQPMVDESDGEPQNADDSKEYVPSKEDNTSESTQEPVVDLMDVDADDEQPVRKLAERKPAERKLPERKLAERKSAERKRAGRKLAERQPEQRKLAERQPVERKLAERKLAERDTTVSSPHGKKVVEADDDPHLAKLHREGSTDTQDTQDEPISRTRKGPQVTNLFPEVFEDEEVIHDTASDEEKLGWVSKPKNKSNTPQAQVGDYISVDPGSGTRRNGFVEAYLPETDTHFVAFCDEEGGNIQIKLTSTNHSPVKEDQIAVLRRRRAANASSNGDDRNAASSNNLSKRGRILSDSDKRRESKLITPSGKPAGAELCGRCISLEWPGTDEEFVALVMAYSPEKKQHNIVYFADHCIETVDLRRRSWVLIPRDREPWAADGMLGKRVYVFWNGEYDDPASQALSTKIFGEDTKVPYEAYVLNYEGMGKYKILYPASEDFEVRELKADGPEDVEACEKEWDILEDGVDNVSGLPLLSWTG